MSPFLSKPGSSPLCSQYVQYSNYSLGALCDLFLLPNSHIRLLPHSPLLLCSSYTWHLVVPGECHPCFCLRAAFPDCPVKQQPSSLHRILYSLYPTLVFPNTQQTPYLYSLCLLDRPSTQWGQTDESFCFLSLLHLQHLEQLGTERHWNAYGLSEWIMSSVNRRLDSMSVD